MAGRGAAPKPPSMRRNHHKPAGEWTTAPGHRWVHGETPKPPSKLLKVSQDAWATWFDAWFSSFWSEDDLPGLYVVIRLYDDFMRGSTNRAAELRLQFAEWGITAKGQRELRRLPPDGSESDIQALLDAPDNVTPIRVRRERPIPTM